MGREHRGLREKGVYGIVIPVGLRRFQSILYEHGSVYCVYIMVSRHVASFYMKPKESSNIVTSMISNSTRLSAFLYFGLMSTFLFRRTAYPGSCLSMHLNMVFGIYHRLVLHCFHICKPMVYFDSPKRTFKEPNSTIPQIFHRDGEVSMI